MILKILISTNLCEKTFNDTTSLTFGQINLLLFNGWTVLQLMSCGQPTSIIHHDTNLDTMTTTLAPSACSLSQSTLASSPPSKYRYSAIDDLQLPPALSVTPSTPLSSALTMALEREYSQLTVISPEQRKLLGYLDVPLVMEQLDNRPQSKAPDEGEGRRAEGGQRAERDQELLVKDVYTRFDRRKSVGYTVITPDTSLDVLEEFLTHQKFAIGISL
jgi:hypothetical protein